MSTRDELAEIVQYQLNGVDDDAADISGVILAHLAAEGMVVLGPDGEPLDVRPALRALGLQEGPGMTARNRVGWLEYLGITGLLADACLAAAEVDQ